MGRQLFNSVSNIFSRYGNDMNIYINEGEAIPVKAFIQPLRYKNKMYIDYDRTELGIKDNSLFLYMGPATPDITGVATGTVISFDGKMYTVKRADKIGIDEKTAYIWGILTLRVKDGSYEYL